MGAHADLDDAAFEGWIRAFRGPLVGLLASWGATWTLADELAQDAFAEAWVARARFRGAPADVDAAGGLDVAGAWLRGIAWNLWRARGRREAVRRAEPLADELAACEDTEPDDPEDRRALLRRAFARLSGPHQSVLRMTYLEETSPREVAALLGITPKAVESRLYHARRALRELVERAARRRAEGAKP